MGTCTSTTRRSSRIILLVTWLCLGGESLVTTYSACHKHPLLPCRVSNNHHHHPQQRRHGNHHHQHVLGGSGTGTGRTIHDSDKHVVANRPTSTTPTKEALQLQKETLTQQLRLLCQDPLQELPDTLIQSIMELMRNFAQLGEAEEAQQLYDSELQQVVANLQQQQQQLPGKIVSSAQRIMLLRYLLHAWSQRLRVVPPKSTLETRAIQQAARALQEMIHLQQQQQQQPPP